MSSSTLFPARQTPIKLARVRVNNICIILVLLFLAFSVKTVYSELVYLATQSGQPISGIFKTIELARHMTTNYDFAISRLSLNLLLHNFAVGIVFFYFFCEQFFLVREVFFTKESYY